MESSPSRSLKSETVSVKKSIGSNDDTSSSIVEGHMKSVHDNDNTNQIVSRVHENLEDEWMHNLSKFLQLMKISSVGISEQSTSTVTFKPSLHRDIRISFHPRSASEYRSNDRQLKPTRKTKNTGQLNRKTMHTPLPFPDDVTLIDLIEFTGKSAQMVDWANPSNKKMNFNDRRLAAQPKYNTPVGSDSLKESQEHLPFFNVKGSSNNTNNLPPSGIKKETHANSQIAKNDGEDVVDCFTYYANTILPQRHGSPEESEFSNGIIKEINQLYWKYKNFNILEGRLSLEQVRNNIIRNLSKRKLYQMMQKCKFTCLEDCILLVSFEKQNLKDLSSADYNVISYFTPWRSEKVIKRRLEVLLKPINIQFTIAEDRLLLKAVEILGQNWNEISRLMRSQKSRRACRSRYSLLVRILRKQTLEEWYQKCWKRKSPPVMLTGQILKIFCAFSYVISNWELVEPHGLSDFTIDNPPHDNDLKRYLRSFDFSVVYQARENFRERMHIYFEFMTCKRKNYAYEKMKFERKIPQSWAAALYLRDIELKPIWDIATPSRFELAIFYYYHLNYSKDTMKKTTKSLMPSPHELLAYPEVSNIVNKEAFCKKFTESSPQRPAIVSKALSMAGPARMQRGQLSEKEMESGEEGSEADSASDWETLSDEESSSEGESVSDTATVSDWDTFSDTETCSGSDDPIIEFGDSDSDHSPQLDESCQAELGGLRVSFAKTEGIEADPDSDSGSQIICFRDVQLTKEMKGSEQKFLEKKPSPRWLEIMEVGLNKPDPGAGLAITDTPSDISALALVMLDHDYCQSYTYVTTPKLKTTASGVDNTGGVRKVPNRCFQNVKQQVIQHGSSSLQTTEGKRYRKRAHRTSQTTRSSL